MSGKRLTTVAEMQALLSNAKRVVMIGASSKPERDSNRVFKYLMSHGYDVVPVNPGGGDIHGVGAVRSLDEVEGPVDIVDVFRNPKDLDPSLVDAAVKLGARALWLQLGVVREDIAEAAVAAGLEVVMDECIKQRHQGKRYCEI